MIGVITGEVRIVSLKNFLIKPEPSATASTEFITFSEILIHTRMVFRAFFWFSKELNDFLIRFQGGAFAELKKAHIVDKFSSIPPFGINVPELS